VSPSDINHLRRLLGWVRCEIGQSPEEMASMLADIADKLGHPPIADESKRRLVEAHDKARSVPKYVRAAVKALSKTVGNGEVIDDAEPNPEDIPTLGQMRKLLNAPD